MFDVSIGTPWMWAGFLAFVLTMLALDLGVFHRKAHMVSLREAAIWSAIWVLLALGFAVGVYLHFGPERAIEFGTGYLIEKALSVDNIFVFVIIFAYFGVPPALQHRVLFWGILGALVTRAIFILVGGTLIARFHWTIYVFGAVLILTGVKLMLQGEAKMNPGASPLVRAFRRFFPVASNYDGTRFFTIENSRRAATPLFLALLTVEATDVIFAIDSIPAIFAITRDPFIVFTSNIFAILGMRSMYFLLAGVVDKFRYLRFGLAGVLLFVGAKMTLVDVYKVPIAASLGVIALLLGGSIFASWYADRRRREAASPVIRTKLLASEGRLP
jgi:tellurite resistance protein TerC